MTTSTIKNNAWLLLTFGEDRQYGGNLGYKDSPHEYYRYDNYVPNHLQIKSGDIAIIRERERLVGIAKISNIESKDGIKIWHRCPECKVTDSRKRTRIKSVYRCRNGHIFDEPLIDNNPCKEYVAYFNDSFIDTKDALAIPELREACFNYNEQLSMQKINIESIANKIISKFPESIAILKNLNPYYILSEDALDEERIINKSDGIDSYIPSEIDSRESVMRQIRVRRGQSTFRKKIINRYGPHCLVSGCSLLDLLEAAHISPYKGISDNNESNGLLLRADLHTLFDLDLMGINPESLSIHFHPQASKNGYTEYEGRILSCKKGVKPNFKALSDRWNLFEKRLK